MNDQNQGVGGSYVIDTATGRRRLVERTDATPDALAAPAPAPSAPEESHAQAETPVNPVAPDDTTSKTE